MNSASMNDSAWEHLFEKYNIINIIEKYGVFRISADMIREFREPRLMAKFDHTKNLPKLFQDNELAILPVTRGDYVIAHFDAYHNFEAESVSKPIQMSMPQHIQSLDIGSFSSETIVLNCAVASGIIADFVEDTDVLATVSGRMSSGVFAFDIFDKMFRFDRKIDVNNSQIEIDGAYEGVNSLALFEVKRDLSDDFLIRQLYYPFRAWYKRITKSVKPIFLVYSNGIYRLFEYAFCDPNNYNSLKLVKKKTYSIEDTSICVSDIQKVLDSVIVANEPQIPFPQADKFERIINICELVSTHELSKSDVTEQYDFDVRQADYYTSAARYLGLVEKSTNSGTSLYSISRVGKSILNLGFKKRQLSFCNAILSHKVFNDALRKYFQNGVMPSKCEIVHIMKLSNLYQVESENTYVRRSSTVRGWIEWIVSLINSE